MPDGPGGFAQNYSCSALLRIPQGPIALRIRNCHPLWSNFPGRSPRAQGAKAWSYYPACASPHRRFGLLPVRSPLLGESLLFSLPAGTKMFQFPAFASAQRSADSHPSGGWVVPFGNPGVKGHLRLTRAYRSLSRPSSPPGAKASTGRPNSLSPQNRTPRQKHHRARRGNGGRQSRSYFQL